VEHRIKFDSCSSGNGFAAPGLEEILSDARWFPLEFDVNRDSFRFVYLEPGRLRDVSFIKNIKDEHPPTHAVSRAGVQAMTIPPARLNLILHSSLGGSTLLARALGEQGIAVPLQEPPILTDVIAFGLRNSVARSVALLDCVTRLLSRPHADGETVVCKVCGIGNSLSIAMAEKNPASRLLCLDTPLDEMLSSYAARGAEGRRAARKLLIGIRNSRFLVGELPEEKFVEYIDLQFAALSWLSMRNVMLHATAVLGKDRVRSISSQQLMERPGETLAAVSAHFGLALDVDKRLASGIFDRHSKTGEPFSAAQRIERTAQRIRDHREEIEPVVEWTRRVAESVGISWALPDPLIG
jgi:hypothetical protein